MSRESRSAVALAAFFAASLLAAGPLQGRSPDDDPPPAGLEPSEDSGPVSIPKERLSDTAYWEDAVAATPDDITLHLALGNAYAMNRRLREAAKEYKEVLRIYPESKSALNNLGSVYRAMGKSNSALDAYRKALRIDPYYGLAHYNLGTIYHGQGYFDRAVESYSLGIKYDPKLLDSKQNPQVVANKLLFVVLLHNYVESAGSLALPLEPAYPDSPEN